MSRSTLALVCFALVLGPRQIIAADAPAKPAPMFNAQVRPIFKAYCFECHGEGEKLKGGLDLRLRRFVMNGGESGPAIVAGKPDASLLLERVTSGEMPPSKTKLSVAEIDILKRWVADGAQVEAPEPESLNAGFQITNDDRHFWAFQPIRRPAVPAIADHKPQLTNPIDAYLLQKLHERGLSFSPRADRLTLIRRVTFDLHGLPPTPEEVDAFLGDTSENAYEKLIDRLLASPRYGERWGRHWLDVAGYADSEGGAPSDPVRANAWKYRDYVIRSFNADKPFDQFTREQLAGDELVKPPYANLASADLDKLTATGFLRMAPDATGVPGIDQKLARNQVITDTVKITASAFLGLTVGCAECHNHRYDPIPQADFYRLRAVFEPAYDTTNWKPPASRQVSLYTSADRAKAAEIEAEAAKLDKQRLAKQSDYIEATFEKELKKLPMEIQDSARAARTAPAAKRTPEQHKLMREHPSLNVSAGSLYLYDSKAAADLKKMAEDAATLRKKKPVEEFIRVLTEVPGKLPPTFIFHRGDPDQPKDKVTPGGLVILDGALPLRLPEQPSSSRTSGRRLALANWLTDPRHPLTARVIVNRIWMDHFGRGLVGTPGDFGRLGERPTHPELLDWLASEFVAPSKPTDSRQWAMAGAPWSMKRLHKLILTSTAYQQSSRREGKQDSVDPDNHLLGRFPLRRLDAETIRDSLLLVSGKLNSRMFGPPIPVMDDDAGLIVIGKANRDGAGYKLGDESVPAGDESRRSVYVQVRRSKPLAILDVFDGATAEPNCEARHSSTATPQSLMLLNGTFATEQAAAFAERIQKDVGDDTAAQVTRVWRLVYGCNPNAKELDGAIAFLTTQTAAFQKQPQLPAPNKGAKAPAVPAPKLRALAALCQAILSSNRFLYVD